MGSHSVFSTLRVSPGAAPTLPICTPRARPHCRKGVLGIGAWVGCRTRRSLVGDAPALPSPPPSCSQEGGHLPTDPPSMGPGSQVSGEQDT